MTRGTTIAAAFLVANPGPVLWRSLGLLVLAAGIAFVFVFLPVPLLFAVWAAWFTVRQLRDA